MNRRLAMTWKSLVPPALTLLALLGLWEIGVRWAALPEYILPAPSAIAGAFASHGGSLLGAAWVTLSIALAGLFWAVVLGLLLAIVMTEAPLVGRALFPLAVIIQVTPVIAIAPLLLIWLDPRLETALTIMAFLVAFFPILLNTTQGLRATRADLLELFRLYRASRWQLLWRLKLPFALPHIMSGVRVAGGLALIGAVVAEFAAGTAGLESGLAFRILEAGYRLNMPRMFAALVLLAGLGVMIYGCLSLLQWLVLRRWPVDEQQTGVYDGT